MLMIRASVPASGRVEIMTCRVELARVIRLGRRLGALIQHPRAAEILVHGLQPIAAATDSRFDIICALQPMRR